ncbi:MAG: hypothetical protein WCX95_02155 [Candidatus Gracilibacteria bacterium]
MLGLFLFIGTKLLLGPYNFSRALNLYDEGVFLTGAKRFAQGEMPYKDFWTLYAPLNSLSLGWIFKIFGQSIYIERTFNLVISLLGLSSIYVLFRTKTNFVYAGVACLFFVLFSSPIKITHLFIFLTLISSFALIKNRDSKLIPIICGGICGLGFINRFDFGGLMGAISVLAFILIYKSDYKKLLKQILRFSLGFFMITIPVLIWLIHANALRDMIDQTVLYPFFGNYSAMRTLPFPKINEGTDGLKTIIYNFFYFFFSFLVVIFSTSILFFSKKLKENKLPIILFILVVIGTIPYLFSRIDTSHFNYIDILALTLFFYTIFSIKNLKSKYLIISLIIPIFLISRPFITQIRETKNFNQIQQKEYSFYSAPLAKTDSNDALEKVYEYMKSSSDPFDPIYIGLPDHTRIFNNNVMLYFLLPNPIATRYHELHPGITNTEDVQKTMIKELLQAKYVILWDKFYCETVNDGCKSSGVKLLDEYIKNNYSEITNFAEYKILKKRNV